MDSSAGTPTLQQNVAAPSAAPERKAATFRWRVWGKADRKTSEFFWR
jgi:hypothetical protein